MDADESLRLSAEQNGNENGSMSSNEDDMNQVPFLNLTITRAKAIRRIVIEPQPPSFISDRECERVNS